MPRDRAATFEPQTVKKRQRRLSGVAEVVPSLYAKGLTTGASVSNETISRITDTVIEEMEDWAVRPLDETYPPMERRSAPNPDATVSTAAEN
ncbi:mutator family transposase [Mycolicibacterium moriokaense]|uniref:Mutator family transposase n=1 Tax=Mycolicibacterium moriokaense TaxID=39691 RepID=A0A318H595_9MYCO|nr:mutator family transposase [Mycolicibacterium moriokaense]